MIGLDTNLLVRLITNNSPMERQRVLAFLDALPREEQVYVNLVVASELVWVLRKRFGYDRATVAAVLQRLTEHPRIATDVEILREAARRYREQGADVADHLIALTNRARGCWTTYTLDSGASRATDFSPLP